MRSCPYCDPAPLDRETTDRQDCWLPLSYRSIWNRSRNRPVWHRPPQEMPTLGYRRSNDFYKLRGNWHWIDCWRNWTRNHPPEMLTCKDNLRPCCWRTYRICLYRSLNNIGIRRMTFRLIDHAVGLKFLHPAGLRIFYSQADRHTVLRSVLDPALIA